MNVYITGINKGCGKTVITAGIAGVMQSFGYKSCVYKPIQTGAIENGKYIISPDLTFTKRVDSYIQTHSTYMFITNAISEIGSQIEKVNIDLETIKRDYSILKNTNEIVIVEAPSSIMTPICDNTFAGKIPLSLNIPSVIVITPSSDNIGSYLAELNCAKSMGLDISGVIINKFPVYSESAEIKSFPSLIEKYSDVKIVGLIRNFKGRSITTSTLISEIINGINLEEIFKMKISKLNMY